MIPARVDRKTQHRIFCGATKGKGLCIGELGAILEYTINPETGAAALTPQLYLKSTGRRGDSLRETEKCPLCGELNFIDLSKLRPVTLPRRTL